VRCALQLSPIITRRQTRFHDLHFFLLFYSLWQALSFPFCQHVGATSAEERAKIHYKPAAAGPTGPVETESEERRKQRMRTHLKQAAGEECFVVVGMVFLCSRWRPTLVDDTARWWIFPVWPLW
jgi:hypothetical protein